MPAEDSSGTEMRRVGKGGALPLSAGAVFTCHQGRLAAPGSRALVSHCSLLASATQGFWERSCLRRGDGASCFAC